MTTTTTSAPASTVRFGRLESGGVLLGLRPGQVAVLGVALAVVTAAVYTSGMAGLLASAPMWLPLAVVGVVSVGGRPVVAWLPVLAHWHSRRLLGQTTHLTNPARPAGEGVLELPGIPGRLLVTAAPSTGAALILDRRAGTVTAVARVDGTGFLLEDGAAQDRKVTGWGRVLASLCQQDAVVRLQVLHRSLPGGGTRARSWWAQHALAESSWAARVLAGLVTKTEQTTDRQETLLAIALRAPSRARRLDPAAAAAVEKHLSALTDALAAADLRIAGWVTPERLGAVLRPAYDPSGAARFDDDAHGTASALVGPMGVAEAWAQLCTDTAWHAVYWVAQWPRSEVHAGFLQPLLLGSGARRSFTLVAEPLPPGRALREIRRAKAEQAADAAHRTRIGQIEDEATRADAAELLRREADLVAGHGDLRFTGLITVTAATLEELQAARTATEAAAAQAMCEIRPLVGQQGQAHAAAALPLARGLL